MSIALVCTVHTCGFLCINLVVLQKQLQQTFIVSRSWLDYITLYSEVDYFLSGFKEAIVACETIKPPLHIKTSTSWFFPPVGKMFSCLIKR